MQKCLLEIGGTLVFFQDFLTKGDLFDVFVNKNSRQVPVIARNIPAQRGLHTNIIPFGIV